MLKHKRIDQICAFAVILAIAITLLLIDGEEMGIYAMAKTMGYENRLFDISRVHTLDIVMDDWEGFIETCTNEEYVSCAVVIDGESKKNVAIRAKGNTSLSSVAAYGNDRYSFKVEFDHYNSADSYYGLDKLSLNNLVQDNTYLKDYVSYTLMRGMGVAAPLCSFVSIRVNGEDWGLYLAVEAIEESFLQRNYGADYGKLYKPDSMSMGANRGQGVNFNMEDFVNRFTQDSDSQDSGEMPQMPEGFDPGAMLGQAPEGTGQEASARPEGRGRGGFGGMGNPDVMLQYVDDDPDSYANIFNNAKINITHADKTRLIQSLKTLSQEEDVRAVVDAEAVIRYFVVHNFLCNGDSYTGNMVHNYYLYEDDGVLSMIPWDYNLAFGAFTMGGFGMNAAEGTAGAGATASVNSPIDSPVSSGNISTRPMIAWIFENETYTELYHQYYAELIQRYFGDGGFEDMLDSVVALISPYIEKETSAFCSYEAYTKAVETLRIFCMLRGESIAGQLDGSIPSTSEGQSADSSSLVDASMIQTSDMGSLGGMGRGSMRGMNGFLQGGDGFTDGLPDSGGPEAPNEATADSQGGAETSGDSSVFAPLNMPDGALQPSGGVAQAASTENSEPEAPNEATADSQGGAETSGDSSPFAFFGMPDGALQPGGGGAQATSTEMWILLAASVAILLAGLTYAFLYKRP